MTLTHGGKCLLQSSSFPNAKLSESGLVQYSMLTCKFDKLYGGASKNEKKLDTSKSYNQIQPDRAGFLLSEEKNGEDNVEKIGLLKNEKAKTVAFDPSASLGQMSEVFDHENFDQAEFEELDYLVKLRKADEQQEQRYA